MRIAITALATMALLASGVGVSNDSANLEVYKDLSILVPIELRINFSLKEIIDDFHMETHDFLRLNGIFGVSINEELTLERIKMIGNKDVRVTIREKEEFCVSWYGKKYHGRTMANGEIFDMENPHIVAHKWLPFGTKVLLRFEDKELWLTVKDRGPFVAGRNFDVSKAAAEFLGIKELGVANCELVSIKLPDA